MTISLKFPDGKEESFKKGVTPLEIAKGISEGLARNAVAAQLNDRKIDLDRPIEKGGEFRLFTLKDDDGMEVLRHSCAHVLAQAVKRLYPKALPTIGPVIENGFMYDFDNLEITDEDLPAIEKEMKKIIKEKFPTKRHDYNDAAEARKDYKDNKYKLEIIDEYKDGELSRYDQGEFYDLCRGPHCPHTGWPEAFALTKTAQAYWRGDSKNKQLTRIYGLCFSSKKELKEHLAMLEEAAKRDHKRIGAELGLYAIAEEIGPGLIIWLPKGNIIKEELENWAKETEEKWGYQRVTTPIITKEGLFHTSEHLPHYSDSMFPPMSFDNEKYYIKPMNCPFHHMVFKSKARSYRELPLRLAEYGWCHRYEQSGAITGLMRVRGMQMNDAHIYCAKEDAVDEFLDVIKLHEYYYKILGITDYKMEIGLRDPDSDKYHGNDEMWSEAERLMREAMDKSGIHYTEDVGGAAFYGPKIDFQIKTAVGQQFTASTNQIDLFMPAKFGLKFQGEDGKEHVPVCIHRAPLGTHERFIGFLIEHFAGKFPLWLSPEQVRVLPITDRNTEFAGSVVEQLKDAGLRVTLDDRPLTTNKKVREAELAKVNYILVIGDREVEAKTVNVRTRENKILGEKKVAEFIKTLVKEVSEKS